MTRHSCSAPKKVMVFLVLLMRVHDTTSLHAHHSQQRRMRHGSLGWATSPQRLTTRLRMSTEEDYKQLRRKQETEEFEARKTELDALRARISDMAKEQEIVEAAPWVPPTATSESVKEAGKKGLPEMTPGMKNIASVLGDDRAGEEEEDLEDLEDWVDPLDGLPIWQQLLEESKRVDWPAPGKVFKTLSYVYGGMIGAAGLVLGVDKLFLAVGKLVFTYGVNPNV